MLNYEEIRKDILNASFFSGACHIGSALSCVEILVDLFNNTLKKDDVFIFSKASGVATLYAILARKGYFPKEKLAYYLKNYPLPSKEVPGVIHSVGSLGHGLPIAVGLALADRNRRVFVLMSDGECQEGTTYESALFARQHGLNNLYVIIDANGIQACDRVENVLGLKTAYKFLESTLPNITIDRTVKGQGISFCENSIDWHYQNLTPELLKRALCEI